MIPPDEDFANLSLDHRAFLDLVDRLSPDRRRVVGVLLQKVALLEAEQGESAALSLIDDISLILSGAETTH
ncbi:MAG: hypothetical protein ACOYM5_02135 [Caulobacter sp.]